MELFFDTETSGFINKSLEADHKDQAWCCQFAAILSTEAGIIDQMNVLIKANGRTIHPKTTEIHGITVEITDEKGIEESEVLEQFALLRKDAPKIICHNYNFDSVFLNHMFERNMDKLSDEARSSYFLQLPTFCTMRDPSIKKYIDARNVKGNLKVARLDEMYTKLFDKPFDGAHDAMVDTTATMECYYELKKREVI